MVEKYIKYNGNIGELNLKKLLKNCSKIIDPGVPAPPSGYVNRA